MGETYYEVLGVAPDASLEEIERAYRERVLETHPDRNDDPDAAEQFTAVTTAADVLTDETERARYDRLGHEAYRGTDSGPGSAGDGSAAAGDRHRPDEDWWAQYTSSGDADDGTERSGPSHHARQRARRERRSNGAGPRWSDAASTAGESAADDPAAGVGSTAGTASTARRGEASGRTASDRRTVGFGPQDPHAKGSRRRPNGPRPDGEDAFDGFAVHQWDDEVELASPFRRLDTQTLIFACGLALLYPVFVYATITPHLPLLVNLVVGSCTLVLVGYLLTLPRIALASFGGWSLLVTGALLLEGPIASISLVELGFFAGFWIPFGYAVGVWVALRP